MTETTNTKTAKLPVVPARDSASIQVPLHCSFFRCFHRPCKWRRGWLPDVVCDLLGTGMVLWCVLKADDTHFNGKKSHVFLFGTGIFRRRSLIRRSSFILVDNHHTVVEYCWGRPWDICWIQFLDIPLSCSSKSRSEFVSKIINCVCYVLLQHISFWIWNAHFNSNL